MAAHGEKPTADDSDPGRRRRALARRRCPGALDAPKDRDTLALARNLPGTKDFPDLPRPQAQRLSGNRRCEHDRCEHDRSDRTPQRLVANRRRIPSRIGTRPRARTAGAARGNLVVTLADDQAERQADGLAALAK